MENIKLNVIVLEELTQPSGNLAFQKVEDFVNQSFLMGDYARIKGEDRIYHKSEMSDLISHLKDLLNK